MSKAILKNQDVMKFLGKIPTNSVDLVLLDPNYAEWDDYIEKGLVEESLRILKNHGNLLCFAQQPFDLNIRLHLGENLRRRMIWGYKKPVKWVSKKLPLMNFHDVYWAVLDKKNHFFNCRSGMPYSENTKEGDKGYVMFEGYKVKRKGDFTKNENGVWLNDLLLIDKPVDKKKKSYFKKPFKLYEVYVRCFAPEGEDTLVVDPFAGGGESIKATLSLGKRMIANESDEKCYKDVLEILQEEKYEIIT